jgi:hypothetical protein
MYRIRHAKRHNPRKRRNPSPSRKRRNPSHKRRVRHNPSAAERRAQEQVAAAEAKARRAQRKADIVAAFASAPKPPRAPRKSSGPRKPRAKTKATGRRTMARARAARQKQAMALVLTGRIPGLALPAIPGGVRTIKKGKNAGQQRKFKGVKSTRGLAVRRMGMKDMPEGTRAIASAWRAAKRAQEKAVGKVELAQLRAMGLAGVPNPGLAGAAKGLVTLLPQMGVTAAAFAGVALGGQKVGEMVEARLPALGKAAVPVTTGVFAVGAYMIARNVKALAPFSSAILAAGVCATVVHTLAKVQAGTPEAPQSLGKKLGLPIGEYTSMGEYTSVGEYTSMGAYHGGQGIFAGLDDDPVFDSLRGTDDEPDFAEDEAEGSLSGSIFD